MREREREKGDIFVSTIKLQYANIFRSFFVVIEYLSSGNNEHITAYYHQIELRHTRPNQTTQYIFNSGLDTVNRVLSE